MEYMEREFNGLCFVNLVDFDMLYGHRNDVAGYAKALTYFDRQLPRILSAMEPEDVLMITADHGCDPGTPSTDHSREYTPFVMYGKIWHRVKISEPETAFRISEQRSWITLDCPAGLQEKACCKSQVQRQTDRLGCFQERCAEPLCDGSLLTDVFPFITIDKIE